MAGSVLKLIGIVIVGSLLIIGCEGQRNHANILFLTQPFNQWAYPTRPHFETEKGSCTFSTNDPNAIEHADMVIFHAPHSFKPVNPRKEGTIWMYFTRESPVNGMVKPDWDFLKHHRKDFNAIMSYDRRSSIVLNYGYYSERDRALQEIPPRIMTLISMKTHMAVTVMSNCGSHVRNERLASLRKFFEIDVMGSNPKCATANRISECSKPYKQGTEWQSRCVVGLGTMYKFYVAIENADCTDYITEKIWSNAFQGGMIPIVWGSMPNYFAFLPPNSYINCEDFGSVETCAEHIKLVADDPQLYLSYMQWHTQYDVHERAINDYAEACAFALDNNKKELPPLDILAIRDPVKSCTEQSRVPDQH